MIEATSRATPVLTDLLQIEPGDHVAIQVGTEFLATKEAQIQSRLARLENDLAGSEDLPDAHLLADQAADALQALLDLLKPESPGLPPVAATAKEAVLRRAGAPATSPAARSTPAPTPLDVSPPAPRQRGLRMALGLALVAWLITLAGFAWLLWRQAGVPATTPTVVTTVLVSPSSETPGRETQSAEAAFPATIQPGGELPTATLLPANPPRSPSIPGAEAKIVEIARAVQLQIPDDSGAGFLQISLAIMAERIHIDDGRPVLGVELPVMGGGLYRASVPFGEEGSTVIALPAGIGPDNLQTIRPGDRLAGCNTDERCYDYRVTAAETWDGDRLAQVLTAWPYDLNLLIYTKLEGGDAWIIQAELEEKSQ